MTPNTIVRMLLCGMLFSASCSPISKNTNTNATDDLSDIDKMSTHHQSLFQEASFRSLTPPAQQTDSHTNNKIAKKPYKKQRSVGRIRVVSGKLVLDSYTLERSMR